MRNSWIDEDHFADAKASTVDFVSIDAYVDAPPTNQQGDVQQWSNALDAKLANYISQLTTAGKKTFLRLQGFDGGGCWHDMNTVAELNRVAYRRAATNTNVLGLTIWNWAGGGSTNPGDLCPSGESPSTYAWGSRPRGPKDLAPTVRPELQAVHQEIYWAITGTGPDSDPPGPVTNVTASAASTTIILSWTNPSAGDFAGVVIRRKTDGYPTGPTDGVIVADKLGLPNANDTYTDRALTNGATYYYSLFAHDSTPNYATKADASATVVYATCFQEAFAYPDGNLVGVGGWTGDATSQMLVNNETLKVSGGTPEVDAYRSFSACSAGSSAIIQAKIQIKSGSGTGSNMWSVWIDDPAGNNLARWYGSASNAIGRTGGTSAITAGRTLTGGWDNLEARIDTVANTTDYFFNSAGIGTLSHVPTGGGDSVGRIWFQRIDNSGASGHYLYFDSFTVGPYDGAPPAGVTSFSAIAGNGQMNLSWVNPPDGDFTGTMIRYKTTGYPTGTTDGTLLVDKTGSPNAIDSYLHTGASNGVTYYYSAFAHDSAPNHAPPAQTTGTPTYFDAYDAKTTDNGQTVVLTAGVISADFADFFYVQTPWSAVGMPAGIRVNKAGHGLAAGHAVGVRGVLATDPANGERVIEANWVKSYDDAAMRKHGMGTRSLGGTDWIDGTKTIQAGIFDPYGPNNVGLLVRVWGKVTQRDTSGGQYFYVDDGSGLLDDTNTLGVSNTGIRVKSSPSALNAGDFVVVTGISTMFKDASGKLRRQVLPQTVGGLQKLVP